MYYTRPQHQIMKFYGFFFFSRFFLRYFMYCCIKYIIKEANRVQESHWLDLFRHPEKGICLLVYIWLIMCINQNKPTLPSNSFSFSQMFPSNLSILLSGVLGFIMSSPTWNPSLTPPPRPTPRKMLGFIFYFFIFRKPRLNQRVKIYVYYWEVTSLALLMLFHQRD